MDPVTAEQPFPPARVISVLMGLGHARPAYSLRDIANGKIIIDGSIGFCTPEEYEVWENMRRAYYFMSRTEQFPLIGKHLFQILRFIQNIPPYYPRRDLSAPNGGVKYLSYMIKKKGLCSTLINKIRHDQLPLVNTFYATAIAADMMLPGREKNYLLICDTDCNRVWVPENPSRSTITYLAPCTRVKKRLQTYGVPENRIFLTGFPLPKENIGSLEKLEVLKPDLFNRLVRLDPVHNFFNIHGKTVEYYLEQDVPRVQRDECFTLTFTVGGAGAQAVMAKKILQSLKNRILQGKIRLNLAAGIREDVVRQFEGFISTLGLQSALGESIRIIYAADVYHYFDLFNATLRTTDVLWTKPSELSFYCALGIPILLAPTVGTQEERNSQWLQDMHTGVEPAGPLEYTGEWLFDLRDAGILAEAAWDGFLKARKLGAFRIEELVKTGNFTCGNSPLER